MYACAARVKSYTKLLVHDPMRDGTDPTRCRGADHLICMHEMCALTQETHRTHKLRAMCTRDIIMTDDVQETCALIGSACTEQGSNKHAAYCGVKH